MRKSIVQLPKSALELNRKQPILLLGSCFSQHISHKCKEHGLQEVHNPLGTIFNPHTIGKFLTSCLDSCTLKDSIFQKEDMFLSWEASNSIYAFSEKELATILKEKQTFFSKKIEEAQVIIITFGSAWSYMHKKQQFIVANCHKIPSTDFEKVLLSIPEIVSQWSSVLNQLFQQYPNVKLMFTVSPVRHWKDGAIENARSKAILIEAVHQLVETHQKASYFPSYEIVVDELRDYGYFKMDGLHPNEIAVNHVWKIFLERYFSPEDQKVLSAFNTLRRQAEHKSVHPNSKADMLYRQQLAEKINTFRENYPEMNYSALHSEID